MCAHYLREHYLRDGYDIVCIGRQVGLALPANFLECGDGGNRQIWVPQSMKH